MNALARFTEVRGTAGDLRGYLAHFGTHAVRLHPGQPQPGVDADADRKAGLEQLAETLHAAALAGDVRAIRHALAVHVLGKPFGNPDRWYWHLAVEIGAEIEVEALVGSLPGLHEGHMTAEDAARDAVATVAQWEDARRAFVAPLESGAVPDPRDPDFTGPYLQPQERTRGRRHEERCIQCDSPVDRCQGLH